MLFDKRQDQRLAVDLHRPFEMRVHFDQFPGEPSQLCMAFLSGVGGPDYALHLFARKLQRASWTNHDRNQFFDWTHYYAPFAMPLQAICCLWTVGKHK